MLQITLTESEDLLRLLNCYCDACLKTDFDRTVVTKSISEMSLALFLSCFEVSDFETGGQGTSSCVRKRVDVRASLSEELRMTLGMFY